ncbi:MAG: diguanylate cyclase [Myxococcales bacterium]|nr:diguanylate cyclase [Myxococcales bacterium]
MADWDDDDDHTVVGDVAEARAFLASRPGSERAYVIVIAGPNLGETHELVGDPDVGRTSEASIHLADSEVSRRHARFFVENGRVVVEDLNSTNGTFVNGERVSRRALDDGDKIQIGTTTILKFSYHDAIDQAFQRRMYDAAIRDGLTGAYNKKYFTERLTSELAYAVRHRSALCLVLFDLDHFKNVNDTYGHLAGDYVLTTLAKGVLDTIRKEDVFARYGGEEFALLSRGIDLEGGRRFSERLRAWIEGHRFVHDGRELPVTASLGVVAVPDVDVTDPAVFVQCADEALYAAKRSGRNRVVAYGD